MRTPGHDEELAAGFLYGEGLITEVPALGPTDDLAANIVELGAELARSPPSRRFYATSSCGICGKGALEEVAVHAPRLPAGPVCSRTLLASLPERLEQPGFARTGGLHATGLFDADGTPLCVREDVGRHNAMDKVVGHALKAGELPLHGRILCVSGRLSFELVQKAAVAGAPILVGVGAPTSLAIDLAADRAMTLCGFARSMPLLIAFRALQGVGSGAIQPISMTIIGDIYSPAERARIQGASSAVWGFAAIIGPALSAFLVEQVHWSVVFWVNLPIGIVSIVMFALFLDENVERREHRIDYFGGALLVVGIGALMLALVQAMTLDGPVIA